MILSLLANAPSMRIAARPSGRIRARGSSRHRGSSRATPSGGVAPAPMVREALPELRHPGAPAGQGRPNSGSETETVWTHGQLNHPPSSRCPTMRSHTFSRYPSATGHGTGRSRCRRWVHAVRPSPAPQRDGRLGFAGHRRARALRLCARGDHRRARGAHLRCRAARARSRRSSPRARASRRCARSACLSRRRAARRRAPGGPALALGSTCAARRRRARRRGRRRVGGAESAGAARASGRRRSRGRRRGAAARRLEAGRCSRSARRGGPPRARARTTAAPLGAEQWVLMGQLEELGCCRAAGRGRGDRTLAPSS